VPLYKQGPSDGSDLKSIGECAGIDLINQPAEARNWVMEVLKTHMKSDHTVTVGNYCYLDGEKHVKVSIAMDTISAAVAEEYVPHTSHLPSDISSLFFCF
jgi:hypothetical protein